jgi:hypothetical protein
MLIISIVLILFIGGILLAKASNLSHGALGFIGVGCAIFGLMGLLCLAITIPAQRMDANSFELELASVQQTLTTAREKNDNLEMAAIQIKVASLNQELVSYQYYARLFPLWYPANIQDVKPIH